MLKDALIEDTIKITAVNKDGKFYEKVSRAECISELFKLKIQLDINTEIYPVQMDQYYSMVILKAAMNESYCEFPWMEKYEYVMHGKIFKCDLDGEQL
jgi:DNA-directed RNA polymerase I, II, and III subunit RPABC3